MGRSFRDLATRVEALEERMDQVSLHLAASIGTVSEAVSAFGETQGRVEKRLGELGEAMRDRPDLQRTIGDAVSAGLEALAADQAKRVAALERGLAGVERLADGIEALDRKRGLRQLAETEQEVRQRLESLSADLVSASSQMSERLAELERGVNVIREGIDPAALRDDVSKRIEESVTALRRTLGSDLGTRLNTGMVAVTEALAGRVREGVAAGMTDVKDTVATGVGEVRDGVADGMGEVRDSFTKGLEGLRDAVVAGLSEIRAGLSKDLEGLAHDAARESTESVQTELAAMRAKIDSWGRTRSAPKINERVDQIEGRMSEMEEALQGRLVDAVFDRMQRSFDRSFEALVLLVETRIREAIGTEEEDQPRRRRFRRSRERDEE
jgi:phage shock protein A